MAETQTDAPPEQAYTPTGFGAVAADVYGPDLERARQQRSEAAGREVQAIEAKGAAMAPAIQAAQTSLARPLPPPPEKVVLPPPPSRQLHDFLAPVEGEPPERSVMKLISALSLLGTGIGGLAKGDARAALAGMTGALKGWQEGDRERADRAYADWEAASARLLKNYQVEHQTYRDIMEDANLTNEQRFKAVQLAALAADNPILSAKVGVENVDAVISYLTQAQNHADQYALAQAKLAESKALHEETLRLKQEDNERKWKELEVRAEDMRQRSLDRNASLEERTRYHQDYLQMQNMLKQLMFETPITGARYYDKQAGEIRQVSKRDWMEDEARRKGGQPMQLVPLTNQQVQTIERLSVAPPILDRVDRIIDKVNAVAKGQNLTTGLINTLATRAGIEPDLQELRSLNLDSALELAAALSGGQPRISILYMLRGEATPGLSMTADTAHRAVQTARTTIRNRLTTATGDPQAMDKLSAPLATYESSATPATKTPDTSGWKIEPVR